MEGKAAPESCFGTRNLRFRRDGDVLGYQYFLCCGSLDFTFA